MQSRNYRLFFIGQIISLTGNGVTQVATMWLAWELTSSPLTLGLVGFVSRVPALILTPFAGVFVDRWPRHRIIICTQILCMTQSLLLAIFALTGTITIWHILTLLALRGFVDAFDMPAQQAFVVEMVDDPQSLGNAIALNSSVRNTAQTIGPAIGGIGLAVAGAGWCFLLDVISYIAVIISLLMMVVPAFKVVYHGNPLQQMRDGAKYVFQSVPIRTILLIVAQCNALDMMYTVLLPIVADKILHGGSGTYSMLLMALGPGALIGALMLAARRSFNGLPLVIARCVLLFGISLLIFSYSSVILVSMAMVACLGFAFNVQMAACNTIIQTVVEPDKRGRVMSFYTMALVGTTPIGSLIGGALAQHIGAANTIRICAIISLCIALWFTRSMPRLTASVNQVYERLAISN